MADARMQELVNRLADLSEEAIQRLSEAPGADRVGKTVKPFRERLDELQRRVRGLEDLERRLTALEKKVDRLSKSSSGSARRGSRSTARRAPSRPSPTAGSTEPHEPPGSSEQA